MLDDGIQVGPDGISAVTDDGKISHGKQPLAGIMRLMECEEQEWAIVKRKGKKKKSVRIGATTG